MSDKFSTFNHEFPPGFAFYFFFGVKIQETRQPVRM